MAALELLAQMYGEPKPMDIAVTDDYLLQQMFVDAWVNVAS